MSAPDWIAVDWGTSNLRLWGIAADGAPLFERQSDQGMARLTPDQFPAVLLALLGDTPAMAGDGTLDVVICGMAGARQGWIEAPYLDAPADLSGLWAAAALPATPHPRLKPRILPGICQRGEGAEDVMRGEETQLLGLAALRPGFSGTVCMPGTHSKWATLAGRRVERFATAMTGELFEAIGAHTVLRHALAGDTDGPDTEAGTEAGLEAGLARPERLTAQLFRARAASLLSGRGPDWCAGYLAGLLVGTEVAAHRDLIGSAPVPVVGSARLSRLYGTALDRIGATAEPVDATEATLAGLAAARAEGSAQ